MKHFFLFSTLLFLQINVFADAKGDPVIQVKASDFIVTYLNAQLSKNHNLEREQGWGLHFYSENTDGKIQIKAIGGYFEKNQLIALEKSIKTSELLFADLKKKYGLEGKLQWKAEINQVKTSQ